MINPNPAARRVRRALVPLLGSTALVATMFVAPTATADEHWKVVASGLDNPRQLSFGPKGDLFVAEAGRGGEGPCMTGPEGDTVCFGKSGAITRVSLGKGKHKGTQQRVLTKLPSVAAQGTAEVPAGSQAIGPHDVVVEGSKKLVFTVGLGADPAVRKTEEALRDMGTLRSATIGSKKTNLIADIAKHEARTNPIHDPDSNPVGFIRHGSGYVVADAGGNTLVDVSKRGRMSTRAVFQDQLALAPPFLGLPAGTKIPAQAVPTSVAKGPDGALYVSQLTGFPFEKGLANIYKVDKKGKVSVYASGLTNVTDLAFGPGNRLYAVQLSTEGLLTGPIGSVVAIPKGGGATHTVVAQGLFAPYGIAIKGKTAYVTTGSVAPGAGEVIAIPLR
ncbi:ScyD/ScyE family protein [Nostocoides sp. F2B08]|uniref:ScyD/ScyE family protein n=1 Tax=Nostocoides sp. F2B08 TaxID=2653936 RepID=UPI001263B240|nr:ScyD/ScyE family protein [Tetrasphaera sp. F2B08]KAB7744821.1 ScyD/ScyE family protein [Tetrasphaera sp. F2B08]